MLPTSTSSPKMPPSGGSPAMHSGNDALMAFRRKLGVPTDQPAPEAKVIAAMSGKMGPDVQRMAESLASSAPAAAPGMPPAKADANGETMTDSMPSPNSGGEMFGGRSMPSTMRKPMPKDEEDHSGGAMFGGRR